MSNTIIISTPVNNNISVVTDETTVNITQPVTNVVEVVSFGPQGPSANITDILNLTPQHPLPTSPVAGAFAVSSSIPPKPYFWDGTSWNALY